MPRTRQALKQRRPAATDDGMNDDAVLVDEPQLLERSRELGRSDEDTPLGLRFQRRDRLAKVTLHLDRVRPRKVAPRTRHDVLRLRLELLCPLAHRARRLFVACHRGPGSLHQLVGLAPEEHRPALIHELRPIVVQLVVRDRLGVIDAPVQSHVETEGEEAHGVGFYEKRAQRAAYVETPSTPWRFASSRASRAAAEIDRIFAPGRCTTKRAPPSRVLLSASISPPCSTMTFLTIASPRPVPSAFVVKYGSKMRPRIDVAIPGPSSSTSMR